MNVTGGSYRARRPSMPDSLLLLALFAAAYAGFALLALS